MIYVHFAGWKVTGSRARTRRRMQISVVSLSSARFVDQFKTKGIMPALGSIGRHRVRTRGFGRTYLDLNFWEVFVSCYDIYGVKPTF